jgi:ketosteroid isomerase-like protein
MSEENVGGRRIAPSVPERKRLAERRNDRDTRAMSRANIDLVRLAYDVAWPQRSVDGFQDRFTDDFTWRQRPEFPGRSVYARDEMHELWADLDETFSEYKLEAVEYADAGEYVVVTVNTSSRLRASNHRIEAALWHVWRVHDGLVAEACTYSSRRDALEAAGMGE